MYAFGTYIPRFDLDDPENLKKDILYTSLHQDTLFVTRFLTQHRNNLHEYLSIETWQAMFEEINDKWKTERKQEGPNAAAKCLSEMLPTIQENATYEAVRKLFSSSP